MRARTIGVALLLLTGCQGPGPSHGPGSGTFTLDGDAQPVDSCAWGSSGFEDEQKVTVTTAELARRLDVTWWPGSGSEMSVTGAYLTDVESGGAPILCSIRFTTGADFWSLVGTCGDRAIDVHVDSCRHH